MFGGFFRSKKGDSTVKRQEPKSSEKWGKPVTNNAPLASNDAGGSDFDFLSGTGGPVAPVASTAPSGSADLFSGMSLPAESNESQPPTSDFGFSMDTPKPAPTQTPDFDFKTAAPVKVEPPVVNEFDFMTSMENIQQKEKEQQQHHQQQVNPVLNFGSQHSVSSVSIASSHSQTNLADNISPFKKPQVVKPAVVTKPKESPKPATNAKQYSLVQPKPTTRRKRKTFKLGYARNESESELDTPSSVGNTPSSNLPSKLGSGSLPSPSSLSPPSNMKDSLPTSNNVDNSPNIQKDSSEKEESERHMSIAEFTGVTFENNNSSTSKTTPEVIEPETKIPEQIVQQPIEPIPQQQKVEGIPPQAISSNVAEIPSATNVIGSVEDNSQPEQQQIAPSSTEEPHSDTDEMPENPMTVLKEVMPMIGSRAAQIGTSLNQLRNEYDTTGRIKRIAELENRLVELHKEVETAAEEDRFEEAAMLDDQVALVKQQIVDEENLLSHALDKRSQYESARISYWRNAQTLLNKFEQQVHILKEDYEQKINAINEKKTLEKENDEKRLKIETEQVDLKKTHVEQDIALLDTEEKETEDLINEETVDLQKEHEDLSAETLGLSAQVDELEAQLAKKRAELEEVRSRENEVQSRIDAVRNKYGKQLNRLSTKRETLDRENNECITELAGLKELEEMIEMNGELLESQAKESKKCLAQLRLEAGAALRLAAAIDVVCEVTPSEDGSNNGSNLENGESKGDALREASKAVADLNEELNQFTTQVCAIENKQLELESNADQLKKQKTLAVKARNFKNAAKTKKQIEQNDIEIENCKTEKENLKKKIEETEDGILEAEKFHKEVQKELLEGVAEFAEKKKYALCGRIATLSACLQFRNDDNVEDVDTAMTISAVEGIFSPELEWCKAELQSLCDKYGWEVPSPESIRSTMTSPAVSASNSEDEDEEEDDETISICSNPEEQLADLESAIELCIEEEDYDKADELEQEASILREKMEKIALINEKKKEQQQQEEEQEEEEEEEKSQEQDEETVDSPFSTDSTNTSSSSSSDDDFEIDLTSSTTMEIETPVEAEISDEKTSNIENNEDNEDSTENFDLDFETNILSNESSVTEPLTEETHHLEDDEVIVVASNINMSDEHEQQKQEEEEEEQQQEQQQSCNGSSMVAPLDIIDVDASDKCQPKEVEEVEVEEEQQQPIEEQINENQSDERIIESMDELVISEINNNNNKENNEECDGIITADESSSKEYQEQNDEIIDDNNDQSNFDLDFDTKLSTTVKHEEQDSEHNNDRSNFDLDFDTKVPTTETIENEKSESIVESEELQTQFENYDDNENTDDKDNNELKDDISPPVMTTTTTTTTITNNNNIDENNGFNLDFENDMMSSAENDDVQSNNNNDNNVDFDLDFDKKASNESAEGLNNTQMSQEIDVGLSEFGIDLSLPSEESPSMTSITSSTQDSPIQSGGDDFGFFGDMNIHG